MSLREIDTLLFSFVNKGLQNSIFDVSMPVITEKYYFIILVLTGWLIIKNKKAAIVPILLAVVSVALSDWISNTVKHLVERPRPCHTLETVRLLVGCGGSFSMPSNHAANASAIIFALSYQSKKWAQWLLLTVAALVGFSRIYVGVHYLSDVIVGALIGVVVSILVIYSYRWALLRYKSNPYSTVLLISLLSLSLFRIYYITQGTIDLSPDEAHYWEWSRRLDLSYYSKGPMIAYLIAFGTAIFGDNVFGIRIMAVVSSVLSSIFMYLLGRQLFDERTGVASAILMQIIPLYSAFGVLFTIDSPFIFFWMLSLYLFYRAVEQQSSSSALNTSELLPFRTSALIYWLLLGISIGLGLLTKYTMAFFYICGFLFLLASKQYRYLLLTRWPYISFILSLVVFSPVVVWNADHNWVTLRHTAGQAHISEQLSVVSSQWSKNFLEFLGSQVGIITPVIFILMIFALFKLKNEAKKLQQIAKDSENNPPSPPFNKGGKVGLTKRYNGDFLFWFSIPIIVFFMLKSLHGKVQANWALPGYATGFVAVSALFIGRWESVKKRVRWTIIVGAVLSLSTTVIAHSLPILKLPSNLDPSARIRGWKELGKEVSRLSDELSKEGPFFIFSDRYQVSSELAFYVKNHPVTYCVNLGRRMNQYDLWPGFNNLIHFNAVFVTIDIAQMPDAFITAFDRCEKKTFTVYTEGRKLRDYSIFTCYDFKGMQQKGITSY